MYLQVTVKKWVSMFLPKLDYATESTAIKCECYDSYKMKKIGI